MKQLYLSVNGFKTNFHLGSMGPLINTHPSNFTHTHTHTQLPECEIAQTMSTISEWFCLQAFRGCIDLHPFGFGKHFSKKKSCSN